MGARSSNRKELVRVDVPTDQGASNDVRRASLLGRVAPGAQEPGARPSLEELFRTLVREEFFPLFRMLHDLLGRLRPTALTTDEFLSVSEAAKVAHVGESTLRGWIRSGRLRAGRAGRLVRIRRADLSALITESRQEERPDPEVEAAKILERNRLTER
jgi:excisionase family DNA binding protein